MTPGIETDKPGRWQTLLQAPAVGVLLLWMLVPLGMTIYFSFIRYSLLNPDLHGFARLENYRFLWQDSSFLPAILNTIVLIGSVLGITVVLGTLLAVLYERRFFGRNAAVFLAIAPFFVMPTVSALVWKNMILHPVYGLLARAFVTVGLTPIDWFGRLPMLSLIIILSWEWLPFAFLILYTSLKSLDPEQKEAALIDGANATQVFFHITIPHLRRAMGVVVMIETIFLLSDLCRDLHHHLRRSGPCHHQSGLPGLFARPAAVRCRHRFRRRHPGGHPGQYCRLFPGADFGPKPERSA